MSAACGSTQITPDSLAQDIKLKLPGFEIKAQDLKAPTSELVVAYYTRVIEEFGVDFGQSYHLNDIAHTIKLYHVVAYLFSKLGIRFFSFDDLVNPGSKRTLQLFTIMDNFHSFADQQAHEVTKQKDKREARLAALHQLTRTKDELLEQENQQVLHRATRLEQGHQLQKHTEELKVAKVAAVEKKFQQSESSKIIEEKKLVEAKATVEKLAAAVAKIDEELAQVEKRIVTKTAEELQREVAEVEMIMHSLEDDIKVQNDGLQQKVERVRSLAVELAGLEDSNCKLKETVTQLCTKRQMSTALLDVQRETESVEDPCKQTRQELQAQKKEHAKLKKDYDKAKRDLGKKVCSLEDSLKKLEQEFTDLRKFLEEKDVELASVCDQTSSISASKEEVIAGIKKEHKEYEDAYERYKLLVKCYAEGILKGVKNYSQSLDKFIGGNVF